MNFKKLVVLGAVALATVAMTANNNLKLVPGVFGTGSTAKWLVTEQKGGQHHVLLLSKNVATSENTAAGADVQRIAGTPVSSLTGLSWKLVAGTPGGGAPRWNVYYGPANGDISGYS